MLSESSRIAGQVSAEISEFLQQRSNQLADLHPQLAELTEQLIPVISQGKRVRPLFGYWGYRATGASETPEIFKAVSALEWVHISALIHDDVIDDSDTRRGFPALHKSFANAHPSANRQLQTDNFGKAAAILLGDLCLAWADQALYESGIPAAQLQLAKPFFDAMRTEVGSGQYLDVLVQHEQVSSADLTQSVLELKSAKYTVERPLQIGAALAGGATELLAALSQFGLPVGVAFQLRDDLLGVFGDPEVTGKPAGDDLREGKQTRLIQVALDLLDRNSANWLKSVVGNRTATADEIVKARDLLRDCGAARHLETEIEQNLRDGLAKLESSDIAEPAKSELAALAKAASYRVK